MQFYALLFDIYLLFHLMGAWLILSLGSTDMGQLFHSISKQIRHFKVQLKIILTGGGNVAVQ